MRFSRLYEQTTEFRSRCMAFDFAVIAQTVVEIALETRKKLAAWWKKVKPVVILAELRPQNQLVLELDGIAQIPFFKR